MNFNFIIVFALLFTPLTSVESDFEQLTLTCMLGSINNQDEVPKHFYF